MPVVPILTLKGIDWLLFTYPEARYVIFTCPEAVVTLETDD